MVQTIPGNLFLFLILFSYSFIHAQIDWKPVTNIYGGEVYDLKKDFKGNFYSLTSNGLYKSGDDCKSWTKVDFNFREISSAGLYIHPSGRIFIQRYWGYYYSDKEGKEWSNSAPGMRFLFNDSRGNLYGVQDKSIYYSPDTCKTWILISTLKNYVSAIQPIDDNNIIAAVDTSIYYSNNFGLTWELSPIKYTSGTGFGIDSKKNIYMAANSDLYSSSDFGKNWKVVLDHKNQVPYFYINNFYIDPSDGIYICKGKDLLFKEKGETNWDYVGKLEIYPNSLIVNKGGELLVTGGRNGVYKLNFSTGLIEPFGSGVSAYTVDKFFSWNNKLLFTVDDLNFISGNGGVTWQEYKTPFPPYYADKQNRLYAVNGDKLYYSEKENEWKQIQAPASLDYNLYSIGVENDLLLAYGQDRNLYRSPDLGKTWQIVFSNSNYSNCNRKIIMVSQKEIYITNCKDIYRSIDEGLTWNIFVHLDDYVNDVSVSPWGNIYIGTASGVFVNNLYGWQKVNLSVGSDNIRKIVYTNTNQMLLMGSGIYCSDDKGSTFKTIIDPGKMDGANLNMEVTDEGNLFLVNSSARQLLGSKITLQKIDIPDQIILSNNYPNPFNGQTHFKFSLPSNQYVTIKIYDLLGREIETLLSKELLKGNYKIAWEPKDLSTGVYFYSVISKDFASTRKLIYLK